MRASGAGYAPGALSLKEGDIFFVETDKDRIFQVLESSYVFEFTNTRVPLWCIADFANKSLIIVRKATLTLEI